MPIIDVMEYKDLLEGLWDQLLDKECLNVADTIWGFQHKNPDGDNPVHYYPPVCQICLDQQVPFTESVKCKEHARTLTDDNLLDHFSGKPFKSGSRLRGALGISIDYKKQCKVLVIDFDNKEAVEALRERIIPFLKEQGIDYMVEHGPGDLSYHKCHLWLKVEKLSFTLGHLFLVAMLAACGITEEETKALKLELYPKKRSYIRLFGGYHLRRSCVYPISRKGKTYYQATEMIRQFLEIEKLEKGFVENFVKNHAESKKQTERPGFRKKAVAEFKYLPKNLKIHDKALPGMSRELKVIARSCQAINRVIEDVYEDGALDLESEHEPGLFLGGACLSLDKMSKTYINEEWFIKALDETREGGAESAKSNQWLNHERPYFVKCSSWKDLGYCQGCTFPNHDFFSNPSQLLQGKRIKKTKVREVDPVSVEEGRIRILHKARNRIIECIDQKIHKDIVIAGFPSLGKSYDTDRIAADLAKEGKYVLIAVPNADLAMQHKKRLEQWGVRPFIVMSHKNLFKRNKDGSPRISGLDLMCPSYADIQRLSELGVGSKTIKRNICKQCPFETKCPYPGQYTRAGFPEHNVVIIQHAHFNCRETLFTLLSDKRFDCMFVDEEFISNTYVELKPNQFELERFLEIKDAYPWLDTIYQWLTEGLVPEGNLNVKEEDLESVKEFMDEHSLPWNVPTYVMYFNAGHLYDKRRGLFVFYPLPDVPVRIFTDATPPKEMLEIILDNKNIEYFGEDEILDYTILNKNTKIRQVLDSSTSKSALAADDFALFYEWLEFIGDDVRSRHRGKKILITTYQDESSKKYCFLSRAEEWLQRNYPDIFINSEIIISWMTLGTNEFADCRVQYQLAGLHFNTLDLYKQAYYIKLIANWWNRIKGRPIIPNMYPWHVTEKSGYEKEYIPLRRIELDYENGPGVYEYEFDPVKPWEGFYDTLPRDFYLRMVWKLSLAKRQQAMRIIRNSDKLDREVIIADKSNRATQAVAESFLIDELLGYLRQTDDLDG